MDNLPDSCSNTSALLLELTRELDSLTLEAEIKVYVK